MWRPLFLSVLVGLLFASQAARGLVFLPDDRISVEPSPGSLYGPIGLVYDERYAGRTTGFLISDCEVLTVRHLFRGEEKIVGRRAYFFAGTIGSQKGGAWSDARVTAVGPDEPGKVRAALSPADWAVLRLKTCLGKTYGSAILADQSPGFGEPLQMAGCPLLTLTTAVHLL